ncbi:MAG: hypothetical protein HY752_08565, partial [Nitrospirae bacterium]|nr:hypothetical protein [Nitrospirota bacterium]
MTNKDFCKSLRFLSRKSGVRGLPFLAALLFVSFVLSPSISYSAVMGDYCSTPPYAGIKAAPNIMIGYENGSEILNRAYSTTYSSTTIYYGFFNSNYNYWYDSGHFIKSTTCAPSETTSTNCFSGNLLNWALMSSVDLSRKTLIGFGVAAAGRAATAGNIFTYTGDLDSEGQADSATVSGGGYTFCLSANQTDPTDIIIRFGTGWANCNSGTRPVNGRVIMRFTDESRTGIIQEYGDKDQNYIYDTDAPRFGVRRWTNSKDKQVDIIRDSPALTDAERESYFRLLLTNLSKVPPIDSQDPYLGDMMKEIVKYFSGQSNRYEDNEPYTQTPYSWANDPLKACRKTYALFVTTGTYLGQDKLSPLPSACSSLTYTDAFPTNTCYAYYTDLYTTDGAPPRQNISTYVVHFGEGAPNEAQLTYAANISNGKYLKLNDLSSFKTTMDSAMSNILSVANISSSVLLSGSSPSMIASTQGSGASLIQAYSYPLSP